ncbi:hypothetical protein PAAG_07163 [Paracoccidioides lutzii Pb01]|uniref:Uncharacterized protein n=1 Tax=Paracoccidioides lutzii (strain ATCC MYA-826 / Pb01) TaxID=502779 RepID=C1H8S2_PARBA|nr:hypothetical protein PAAG_07163 [Paracoccidioides lutzii Pb01]EEH36745.2 hypothetical protein PAAG_07163 [Paracoccidioides lutzii Pb01]
MASHFLTEGICSCDSRLLIQVTLPTGIGCATATLVWHVHGSAGNPARTKKVKHSTRELKVVMVDRRTKHPLPFPCVYGAHHTYYFFSQSSVQLFNEVYESQLSPPPNPQLAEVENPKNPKSKSMNI